MNRDVYILPETELLPAAAAATTAPTGSHNPNASPSEPPPLPQRGLSGGAVIDVSPNGSWLAWFRTARGAPQTQNDTTVAVRGSKTSESLTQDKSHDDEAPTTQSSEDPSPESQSAITPPGEEDRFQGFWGGPWWTGRQRRRRTIWIVVAVIVLLVILAIVLLIVFLWAIPHIIQQTLDASTLTMQSAILTHPTPVTFQLEAQTQVWRQRGQTVTLDPFDVHISYVPKTLSRRRRLGAMTAYALGTMRMPKAVLSGTESLIDYKTEVSVRNMGIFDAFLRELVTTGSAQWLLAGRPIVRVLGLAYSNIVFSKTVQVEGPRLAVPTNDDDDHTGNHTDPIPPAPFRIVSLAMHANASNVGVHVVTELENTQRTTIDPFGTLEVVEVYHGTPILQLQSAKPFGFVPGTNRLTFQGMLAHLDDLGVMQRRAMQNLLSGLFRGQPQTLETEGLSSSIPLYNAAAEAIRLKSTLPAPQAVSRGSSPFVRTMEVGTLDLVPGPDIDTELRVAGKGTVQLANPFGPAAILEVSNARLDGFVSMDDGTTIAATFTGTLQSADRSGDGSADDSQTPPPVSIAPQRDSVGVLRVYWEDAPMQFDFKFDLVENGDVFREFVHKLLREDWVIMSLTNVTSNMQVETPLGLLDMHAIPLNQDLNLTGYGSLKDVRLLSFDLGSLPFFSAGGAAGNIEIRVSVLVPSRATTSLFLGDITVDLRYRGNHLAYLTAPSCTMQPGDNVFHFKGTVHLLNANVATMIPLVTNYLAGRTSIVDAEIVPSPSSPEEDREKPTPKWLKEALVGLQLTIPLPGLARGTPPPPEAASGDATTHVAAPIIQRVLSGGGGKKILNSLVEGLQSAVHEVEHLATQQTLL